MVKGSGAPLKVCQSPFYLGLEAHKPKGKEVQNG